MGQNIDGWRNLMEKFDGENNYINGQHLSLYYWKLIEIFASLVPNPSMFTPIKKLCYTDTMPPYSTLLTPVII